MGSWLAVRLVVGLGTRLAVGSDVCMGSGLVVGLVVGIIVSLLQTVTQLQEPTLAYVPKIIAIFAALLFFFPYMGIQMAAFMERLAKAIIAGN
jgi:flagellar biosynthetic protein FliQ